MGPVRSVRSEVARFSCKSGNCVEGSRSLAGTIDYDANGNLTHAFIPGIQPYCSFAYSADGDRLERDSRTPIITPLTPAGFEFPADIYLNVTFYRWTFKYDERGNRVEEARYMRRNRALFGSGITRMLPLHTSSSKYGQDDRKSEVSHYNSDGSLTRKVHIEYDGQGSISVETEVKESGKEISKRYYSYEHDTKGNWIKRITSMWIKQKNGSTLFLPVEVMYRSISYN